MAIIIEPKVTSNCSRSTCNIFLLLLSLLLYTSCNGQGTTQNANSSGRKKTSDIATGDTVSSLGKSAWYVFQDKDGNYWFGSNGQGVYRYNGKKLVRYTGKQGLCNDSVRGIQADKAGNIYINTVRGISKFDGRAFATLKITKSGLPHGEWRLHDDDLWFTGAQDSGVIYRYDGITLHRLTFPKTKAGEEFISKYPRSLFPQMTFSPYDVYSIYKDRKGNLWLGTNIGLCRYDGETFGWMSEKELGIDAIAFHVRSTVEDRNGHFWFSNTLHRFIINPDDPNKSESINFRKEPGITNSKKYNADDLAYFMSGIEDKNGHLWLATYNRGVWRYDGTNITHYEVKDSNENVALFSIYKDKQGDLWLGTHTAGAYKFNGKAFDKFKINK